MGKQINFYMDDLVQNCFLDFIKENQFVFLSHDGEMIDNVNDNDCYGFYIYKKEFGSLYFKEYDKSLDILSSPVIEVKKTRIKGQKIFRGRVWVSDIFYKDNKGNLDYCKMYIDEYQKINRWIKKNVPYQEVMMSGYSIKTYASDLFVDIEKKGFRFTT